MSVTRELDRGVDVATQADEKPSVLAYAKRYKESFMVVMMKGDWTEGCAAETVGAGFSVFPSRISAVGCQRFGLVLEALCLTVPLPRGQSTNAKPLRHFKKLTGIRKVTRHRNGQSVLSTDCRTHSN